MCARGKTRCCQPAFVSVLMFHFLNITCLLSGAAALTGLNETLSQPKCRVTSVWPTSTHRFTLITLLFFLCHLPLSAGEEEQRLKRTFLRWSSGLPVTIRSLCSHSHTQAGCHGISIDYVDFLADICFSLRATSLVHHRITQCMAASVLAH